MKRSIPAFLRHGLCLAMALAIPLGAHAQVRTNWVAYNDYTRGPIPDPGVNNGWGTPAPVTGFDMGFGPGGQLVNYPAGVFPTAELPAGYPLVGQAKLIVTPIAATGVFGLPATPGYPFPDTPGYGLFHGIVDMGNLGSAFGVGAGSAVNLTFANLNPAMRYKFRGSVTRAGAAIGTHDVRWTLNSITGALSFVDAHSSGRGMVTSTSGLAGLTLTNGQAAFQSGFNTNGMVVGWDDIAPAPDGTFTVVNQPYNGVTDVDSASANVGYVLTAIVLVEYGAPSALAFTAQPPATVAATELIPFGLTVKASGTAPYYQWYKQGSGAIPGANLPTLAFDAPRTGDSGVYYAIVSNALGSITSSSTTVTVAGDSTKPAIARVIGNATFDGVTVEFTEPVAIGEAEDFVNYTISGAGGAVGVLTAAPVTATGRIIDGVTYVSSVILTCETLEPDTAYSLKAESMTDGAGNVTDNAPAPFRSWLPTAASGLTFEAFFGIGGNAITDLTGHPNFPNSPSTNALIGTLDSRVIFPDNSIEGYGGRVRGLFIPPYSGKWRFYLRSDDAGRLYFNPAGPSATGKVMLIDETACCGDWNKFQSDAYPLVAGSGYYIEALYKEGTGGDYVKIAARLDGTGNPPTGTSDAGVDPASLTGSAVGYPAAPKGVAGTITIVQQPADVNVAEGKSVTFSVNANNTYALPITYQWLRDGAAIPGANAASYSFVTVLADDNSHYAVDLSIIGAAVESVTVTLHVSQDKTPPTVVSSAVSSDFSKIIVTFSELLDPGTAGDYLNYSLFDAANAPIAIASAALRADGKSVTLTLDPSVTLAPGTAYHISIIGVADLALNPVAADTVANFSSYAVSRGFVKFDYYSGISGNTVAGLTADPRFLAESPTTSYMLPSFDTRTVFPNDSHENYGGRISGVFIPPTSGNWVFYLSSDDSSELWFNATGPGANGATKIVEETTCCEGFGAHSSDPQALTAGQPYYLQALYKEGTGGDYCQVAAKLDTDLRQPGDLLPISGGNLGVYIDTTGASVAITQQPVDAHAASPVIKSATIAGYDFSASDGGFTVQNNGPVGGPWIYNAAGGYWSANGTDPCGTPSYSVLASRRFVVDADGAVVLRFNHRFSFEADSTLWDGGQLRMSVNDGPFVTVTDFAQNGYNGVVGGNNLFTGQNSFTGQSAGYATPATIDTDANLGTFVKGDKIRLQFIGAWDECTRGPQPNWLIRSLSFTSGSLKEITLSPASFTVAASGVYNGSTTPPLTYVWQKNSGAGYVDILNATSSTLTLLPEQSDNGTLFRCLVFVPGAGVTSASAKLIVGPDLDITRTAPNTVVLSWAVSAAGYTLQSAPELLTTATTVWTPVGAPVTVVNDNNTVTLTGAAAGMKYYRLVAP